MTWPRSPEVKMLEPPFAHSANYRVWGGLVTDFAGKERCWRNLWRLSRQSAGGSRRQQVKPDEYDNSDFTSGWSFVELSSFPSGSMARNAQHPLTALPACNPSAVHSVE